jgi:VHL beta domain
MATTYQYNVQLLSNFLRKQTIVAPFGSVWAAIPNLFDAIMTEKGDFTAKGTGDFSVATHTIDTAIWYQKADTKLPLPEPSLFTFDNILSVVGMLSFAIPDVGMFAFAGVGALQQVVDNVSRELDEKVKLSEVSNPPPDPFQHVVDALVAKADSDEVKRDINTIFGQIHAVQAVLNEYLLSPSQFVPSDLKASRGRPIRAIKTRPGLTREHILDGQQGLGQIFAIEASDTWRKLAGADVAYKDMPLDLGFQQNPYYYQATLTAFLHATVTMLTAMQAYAFLYPLPPKAFEPDWDGTNPDGTPYNPIQAIRATKGVAPTGNLPKNAWDALNTVFDRVNPSGELSFIPRLREVNDIWSIIYTRLSAVALRTGLPANRNGYWYLETDKNLTRQVSGSDLNGMGTDKWDVITEEACSNDQVAFLDWNLTTEKFIGSYTRFHTHLTQNWQVGLGNDFTSGFFSTFEIAALGPYVQWLNDHFKEHNYPLIKNSGDAQEPLNEVFWTAASSNNASLNNANQPGFLSTQQGADVCAWLGFLLSRYCEAYGFDIDLGKDTNTLDFIHLIAKLFYGVYMATGQFLGVPVHSVGQGEPITVNFSNGSGRTVSVFWVDYEGHEKLYLTLPPGMGNNQETYVGHVWNVRDAVSGELLVNYTADHSNPGPVAIKGSMVPITIVNDTAAAINIFWVNDQNQEQSYGTLAPRAVFTSSAFIGRSWVIRDPHSGTAWKRVIQVGPLAVHVP